MGPYKINHSTNEAKAIWKNSIKINNLNSKVDNGTYICIIKSGTIEMSDTLEIKILSMFILNQLFNVQLKFIKLF